MSALSHHLGTRGEDLKLIFDGAYSFHPNLCANQIMAIALWNVSFIENYDGRTPQFNIFLFYFKEYVLDRKTSARRRQ